MRTALALGLVVGLATLTVAEDKKAAFEPAKMVGTWEYKSGVKNDQKVAEEALKGKITITKDMIAMGEGDMRFEFKYTVDTKANPVAIDMEMTKSPFGAGMKAKGIIGFEGGDLVLCYNPDGDGARPEKFSGEKNHLFVLKKAK